MKKFLLIAALAAISSGATAQNKPSNDPNDTAKLTYVEVFNIGQALRQMGNYHDNRQMLVQVPFKFDGMTLISFAVNIRAADDAQKVYQEAYAKFEAHELGDVKELKPEEVRQKKMTIATSDAAKRMLEKPAGALMVRIKESDLCMKSPPVDPCTQANNISPTLLATILPLIER